MKIQIRRAVPALLSAVLLGLCPACAFLPLGPGETFRPPTFTSAPKDSPQPGGDGPDNGGTGEAETPGVTGID